MPPRLTLPDFVLRRVTLAVKEMVPAGLSKSTETQCRLYLRGHLEMIFRVDLSGTGLELANTVGEVTEAVLKALAHTLASAPVQTQSPLDRSDTTEQTVDELLRVVMSLPATVIVFKEDTLGDLGLDPSNREIVVKAVESTVGHRISSSVISPDRTVGTLISFLKANGMSLSTARPS